LGLIDQQYALREEGVQVSIVWFVVKTEGPYVANKLDKRLWQALTKGLDHCPLLQLQNFIMMDLAGVDGNALPR
jgi:hypothetical protein